MLLRQFQKVLFVQGRFFEQLNFNRSERGFNYYGFFAVGLCAKARMHYYQQQCEANKIFSMKQFFYICFANIIIKSDVITAGTFYPVFLTYLN